MGVRTQDVRVTGMLTRWSDVCHCSCCNSNCNTNKNWNPPEIVIYFKDSNKYQYLFLQYKLKEYRFTALHQQHYYWYSSLNSCCCFRFYQSIWIDYLFEVAVQILIVSVFEDIFLLISREPHLGLISNFQGIFKFFRR
jgi:hypothetical protein